MKKLVVVFLVILLAVALGTPFCRYGILGLVRGESFYQGRPTSYWRGVVKDRAVRLLYTSLAPPPPTFFEETQEYLKRLLTKEVEIPPSKKDLAALPVYIDLLGDEDADVRWYAAWTIGNMGPLAKTAIPRLSSLLQDDNSLIRHSTVHAIASIEGREGVDLVLSLMKDQEPPVRRRVANLLGESGQKSEAVLSALREALNDPDEQVRVEAAQALKALTGEERR